MHAQKCIANAMTQDIGSIKWNVVEMGLDDTHASFKNSSIGCEEACPTCGRKCDGDVNDITHVHSCSLGHQIRGFSGIRLEDDFASIETCEEIRDDRRIMIENEDGKWKESTWCDVKVSHANWHYAPQCLAVGEANDRRMERIAKMRKAWNRYGEACITA